MMRSGAYATQPFHLSPLGGRDCARTAPVRPRLAQWLVPTAAVLHPVCAVGRNLRSYLVRGHSRAGVQIKGGVLFLLVSPSHFTLRPSRSNCRTLPTHPRTLPRSVGTYQEHPSGDLLDSPRLYHDRHPGAHFLDHRIHTDRRTRSGAGSGCNSADALVHQRLLPNPAGARSEAGGAGTLFLFYGSDAE